MLEELKELQSQKFTSICYGWGRRPASSVEAGVWSELIAKPRPTPPPLITDPGPTVGRFLLDLSQRESVKVDLIDPPRE
jgi:hypothetical protein